MKRAYYGEPVSNFLRRDENFILGELAKNNQFALEDLQRNTWIEEIRILKRELSVFEGGYPRIPWLHLWLSHNNI
jgi:hypothetical protein